LIFYLAPRGMKIASAPIKNFLLFFEQVSITSGRCKGSMPPW
jgi:hypothetical protein